MTQHDRHATTRKYEMASQQIKAMVAAPKRQRPHTRGLLRCRICQKRQASTNSLPQSYFAVENLRGIDKSFSFFSESRESTPAPPQPSPQSPPCSPPFLLSPAISPPGSRNSTQCHGHAKKDQTSTNLAIGPLLLGLAMTSHHGDHRQTGRDLHQAHLSPFRTELISRWQLCSEMWAQCKDQSER